MNFKNMRIFTLLLIILSVSVSSVCAADNSTENTIIADNAGSFSDLQTIINNADVGGTVDLDKNYTYSSGDNAIEIDKQIIINGGGAVIDANDAEVVLNITGSGVVLNNLSIVNANVASGKTSAIIWQGENGILANSTISNNKITSLTFSQLVMWTGSNATIENCIIKDNYCKSDDYTSFVGSVYISGNDSTISNTIFENNSGLYGGAVYWAGDNGVIVNSTFTGNRAWYGGAVYWVGSNGSISKSYFGLNNATFAGSAVYYYGRDDNGKISLSIFKDNGAAIAVGSDTYMTVEKSAFFTDTNDYLINTTSDTGYALANANWWGNTADDLENKSNVNGNVTVDNWLYLNATNTTEVYMNKNATVIFSLNYLSDGSTTDDVELPLTAEVVSVSGGSVNSSEFTLGDDVVFSAAKVSEAAITVNVSGVEFEYDFEVKPVKLTISTKDIYEGETAVVNISLPSDATGNLSIYLNGNFYQNITVENVRYAEISDLTADTYVVNAYYEGDDSYDASNDTANLNVLAKVSDYDFNITSDIVYVNQSTTLTVTTLSDVTGNVRLSVLNQVYYSKFSDGVARFSIKLDAGNTTAAVYYPGNTKYEPVLKTINITVLDKITDYLNITSSNITEGENATVTVYVPQDLEGNITVVVNGTTYESQIVDGAASFTISGLEAGNNTISVSSAGNYKYDADTKNITVFVTAKSNVVIAVNNITLYFKNGTRFRAYLYDENSNPLANKTVFITINGETYNKTTNPNGAVSLAINLNSGNYDVVTTFEGDREYKNNTVNSTVTVLSTVNGSDITKIYRNATQFAATFLDKQGNLLTNTEITFNINGIFYNRNTSSVGVARLNINLIPGTYTITSINPSTGEYVSNNVTVLSSITQNKNLTKYYRNGSQFSVCILAGDGSPVGSGEEVSFNINGIYYYKSTNDYGFVTLNINLFPGSYIMTTEYNGLRASNNITVLPVLTGSDITMNYRDGTQYKVKLVDGQGNAYAGQTVTFNINGILYERITNDEGVASLNINLISGQYIITSTYGYASTSNTITIY